jgi:hypothetical protein
MTNTPNSTPSEDLPVPPSTPATSGVPGVPSGRLTLTGTVEPGVESGCFLLQGYLLVGGPRDRLKPDQRIRVTGRVQRDLVTYCQQGIPFLVEAVEPA